MSTFNNILEIAIAILGVCTAIKYWKEDRSKAFIWLAVAIAAVIFLLT